MATTTKTPATLNAAILKVKNKRVQNKLDDLQGILRELEENIIPEFDALSGAARVLRGAIEAATSKASAAVNDLFEKIRDIQDELQVTEEADD